MDNSRIILLAGATGGVGRSVVDIFEEKKLDCDSPELVEYTGMKNLINDVKDSVKLENGKLLFFGGGLFMLALFGVNRPERPGLDLSKQPTDVRVNKELDLILTYKL
ncbi:hypothetical protein HID58_094865 [Brassica napus]|uniref:Uncharacterized protein n=1 Tax=Brassica napus TaxID=3708 RepID=A0ABQ7X5Z1_BRANA|nr:hypothetical protein HID58_094865 [Brassica napus]